MRTRPSLCGGDVEWIHNFINSPNTLLNHQMPRKIMQTENGLTEVLQLVQGLQQR
nr:antitoxin Xre/MbcA/ParS toxin-binding domain-containing protein [Acinetobacter lwoffii]